MKTKLIGAMAVLVLGASLAVAGHGRGEGCGHHPGKQHMEKMAEKLGLSDAQKQQVRSLMEQFETNNKTLLTAVHDTKKQLREARKADDTAQLEALKGTFEAQRAQLKQAHDAQHAKMMSILTAEQRTRFEAMKSQHGEKGGRMHHGGSRGHHD